jgi:hypothetical protein
MRPALQIVTLNVNGRTRAQNRAVISMGTETKGWQGKAIKINK